MGRVKFYVIALLPGLVAVAAALPASAATPESVIYSFTGGSDGSAPAGTLLNIGGTLYGTATGAGETGGSVFAITPNGTETTLATFAGGVNGDLPDADLINVGNTLYGITQQGGGTGCSGHGCGTVFSVTTTGSKTTLYSFQGGMDGASPIGGVIASGGAFYGVTAYGGGNSCTNSCGTVFKITPSGTETVIYRFGSPRDGAIPIGHLIRFAGAFFGLTRAGGAGYGTIFSVTPQGTEKVVYALNGNSDGAYPFGALTSMHGALYGTTTFSGGSGFGTIFKLTSGLETLYSFNAGSDGFNPNGDLISSGGALYGTTANGGGGPCSGGGCGTVFKLGADGTETELHAFQGIPDGTGPQGGLVKIKGYLYGSTYGGGAHGFGSIFKVTK
jgi:uncharacterized repeat protein (TIGR03803 family)